MRLTIVIPVYNTEKFVGRAIESVSHFENINYEILCVNDGSTDNSLAVLKDYSGKLNNLRVISQENQGLSGARNTGIKNAKGKFILFLDADDWLIVTSEKLQRIFNDIKENNIQVYGYNVNYYNDEFKFIGSRAKHPIPYNKIATGIDFLNGGYQPSSACLFIYNKEHLIRNNLFFYPKITQQDVEFTTRLMLVSSKVKFVDEKLYAYYRHEGSITMPETLKGKKKYLKDSVLVAYNIRKNVDTKMATEVIKTIEKNYNSVIWNLLWRFYQKPAEVDYEFKLKCLQELKAKKLYPIKGALKTSFQRITRIFFNQEFLLKWLMKK